jgi:hypothetical protein
MAAGITEFGASAWLAALFGIDSAITGYYIALANQEPGVDADGDVLADIEPDDTAYARQFYAAGATNWAVDGAFLTNLVEIDFPLPTVDWGDISHYVLCSDLTSGDVYAFGEFVNTQFADTDYLLSIPPGGLVISLSAAESTIAV